MELDYCLIASVPTYMVSIEETLFSTPVLIGQVILRDMGIRPSLCDKRGGGEEACGKAFNFDAGDSESCDSHFSNVDNLTMFKTS